MENIINVENMDSIDNIKNIENVDNSGSKEDNDSENVDENIDDDILNVNNSENKENNNRLKSDENYIALYSQSEQDVDDTNETVSKSNSFTLGEVRQALNNGCLDTILPMGGPVYRVNTSKDTNNIDFSHNNVVELNEPQVKIHFININKVLVYYCILL